MNPPEWGRLWWRSKRPQLTWQAYLLEYKEHLDQLVHNKKQRMLKFRTNVQTYSNMTKIAMLPFFLCNPGVVPGATCMYRLRKGFRITVELLQLTNIEIEFDSDKVLSDDVCRRVVVEMKRKVPNLFANCA